MDIGPQPGGWGPLVYVTYMRKWGLNLAFQLTVHIRRKVEEDTDLRGRKVRTEWATDHEVERKI